MSIKNLCQSSRQVLKTTQGRYSYCSLDVLKKSGYAIDKLPYSIRVLLEAAIRHHDGFQVTDKDVETLATWSAATAGKEAIAFKPGRVILQDFTGVPCVVDLAAMRAAMKRMGGDPQKINPLVPCDLVIDHSVQVDVFGTTDALKKNMEYEFQRNRERYEFLKWGQDAFRNFRIVPPGRGIVHQVNLECLASVVLQKSKDADVEIFPDSVVGTDSHTTMINGLGVVGWGVGGIEAEAVMLGEPIDMVLPEVVGFELKGEWKAGVTATDVVLTITQILRQKGVVGKFVEFFGRGMANMSLANRATIANMAPEYGATMGFFPVDGETLNYLRTTGRSAAKVELVEAYAKVQGLFYTPEAVVPAYSAVYELDLSTVEPCLAGPKRPQDRVPLKKMKEVFQKALQAPVQERGYALAPDRLRATAAVKAPVSSTIGHGSVVIAAITSCTNTSNPSVLIGAGLVAKKAVARGLKVKPYVKTSLAPGSTAVTGYLEEAGLLNPLSALGFQVVGYGCTTCIGNSGPLPDAVAEALQDSDIVATSVLSGNRNFEGRVHPQVKANYLASPLLVVAYALAGTVDIDLDKEPLGQDVAGKPVYLKDIWPTPEEIETVQRAVIREEAFADMRDHAFEGNEVWQAIAVVPSELYAWHTDSTYIQEPPYFDAMLGDNMGREAKPIQPIQGGRVLLLLGDSVTTDHISPAGSIKKDSPAGRYLQEQGVNSADFNSYGARRGNDRVMTRGTFANIRLRNLVAPGTEGCWTTYFPENKVMSVYDAAMLYKKTATPLVILAGKEYGSGSSRDWAAKGTALLGVRVVIAESYERIHRSNLAGMGIIPLQFKEGESAQSLGLKGDEVFSFPAFQDDMKPGSLVPVHAVSADGRKVAFEAKLRIDTAVELSYIRNGGILPTVLRKLMATA